jgi:hypothetical protein
MAENKCVCCGEIIPEGTMVCSICSKSNENLVTPEFICEQLAECFDEPCNMSPFEEELHDTEEKTNGVKSFAGKQPLLTVGCVTSNSNIMKRRTQSNEHKTIPFKK